MSDKNFSDSLIFSSGPGAAKRAREKLVENRKIYFSHCPADPKVVLQNYVVIEGGSNIYGRTFFKNENAYDAYSQLTNKQKTSLNREQLEHYFNAAVIDHVERNSSLIFDDKLLNKYMRKLAAQITINPFSKECIDFENEAADTVVRAITPRGVQKMLINEYKFYFDTSKAETKKMGDHDFLGSIITVYEPPGTKLSGDKFYQAIAHEFGHALDFREAFSEKFKGQEHADRNKEGNFYNIVLKDVAHLDQIISKGTANPDDPEYKELYLALDDFRNRDGRGESKRGHTLELLQYLKGRITRHLLPAQDSVAGNERKSRSYPTHDKKTNEVPAIIHEFERCLGRSFTKRALPNLTKVLKDVYRENGLTLDDECGLGFSIPSDEVNNRSR